MRKLILKLNHILFWWYYRKVTDHFKGYTFFKSVSLLWQHYDLSEFENGQLHDLIKSGHQENEKLRKENSQLRISQIATDGQIRWANETFGINWNPPTDN